VSAGLCLVFFPSPGLEETSFSPLSRESGRVVAVYDGDTIKVKFSSGREQRVRLIGVDAPEMKEKDEECRLRAFWAKRFLFHHLFGREVELSFESEREDKFGRLLAYVWNEKGLVNEFILREGFARAFRVFSYVRKEDFIRTEKKAREKGRGFWRKSPFPLIGASETGGHIGKLRRVRFRASGLRRRGRVLLLLPEGPGFSAVFFAEHLHLFPPLESFMEKELVVRGFLETYRGKPQIQVVSPLQVEGKTGRLPARGKTRSGPAHRRYG